MDDFASTPDLLDLFEHAPFGYVVALPDGTLIRVNQTFLELTRYTRQELEGIRRFQDLLPTAARAFFENQYAPLLRIQGFVKEVAFDLVTQSGERVPVLVNAVQRPDQSDRPSTIAFAFFEATDRRAYERELLLARRETEALAAVVTASHDPIVTVAANGNLQTWNPAAQSFFGRSTRAIAGEPIGNLIPLLGDPSEWQRVRTQLLAGAAVILETHGVGADGHPIDISISLAAHHGLTGQLEAVSLIIRDSSERSALERQKDEFMAAVSHDLKSPVAAIKAWAQLLIRRTLRFPEVEGQQWRHDLAMVDSSAGRLNAMIDELLDLTQVQLGRPLDLHRELVDLVALVRRAADEHQQQSRTHTIVVNAGVAKLEGQWDQARLERVVGNLLSNAIKYSPDDGSITLTIEREVTLSGQMAVLSVCDSGLGIPSADLPRIFDRFYRASNVRDWISGTGIGLAGVKQLVEQHQGSIEVESTLGVGTSVVVRLPLANED
jgi:two-component system phosphate regulon sensor histidine kinase PhoR